MATSNKITVLVIDGTNAFEHLADHLNSDVFDVVGLEQNGSDGLRAILEHRPQLIICDLMLSGVDGFKIIQEVKAAFPQTKIVVASSLKQANFVARATSLGCDLFLPKPVNFETIEDSLLEIIFPAIPENSIPYINAVNAAAIDQNHATASEQNFSTVEMQNSTIGMSCTQNPNFVQNDSSGIINFTSQNSSGKTGFASQNAAGVNYSQSGGCSANSFGLPFNAPFGNNAYQYTAQPCSNSQASRSNSPYPNTPFISAFAPPRNGATITINPSVPIYDYSDARLVAKQIDERISNIFMSVGIPPHIKGFKFLREAIKLSMDTPEHISSITRVLYPAIADKYQTTASKVERAIRHAIEVAWNRGKIENINAIFGVKIYSDSDKPTNGEFIALVADKMLIETA